MIEKTTKTRRGSRGSSQARLGAASVQASYRFPAWLAAQIDREAKRLGLSRNAWLVLTAQTALNPKAPS